MVYDQDFVAPNRDNWRKTRTRSRRVRKWLDWLWCDQGLSPSLVLFYFVRVTYKTNQESCLTRGRQSISKTDMFGRVAERPSLQWLPSDAVEENPREMGNTEYLVHHQYPQNIMFGDENIIPCIHYQQE